MNKSGGVMVCVLFAVAGICGVSYGWYGNFPQREDWVTVCYKLLDEALEKDEIDYDTWAQYIYFPEEVPGKYKVVVPSGTTVRYECNPHPDDKIDKRIRVLENWDKLTKMKGRLLDQHRRSYTGRKEYPLELKINELEDGTTVSLNTVRVKGEVRGLNTEHPMSGRVYLKKGFEYVKVKEIVIGKVGEESSKQPERILIELEKQPNLKDYLSVPDRNIYQFDQKVSLMNYGENRLKVEVSGKGQGKSVEVTVNYYDPDDKVPPEIEVISPKDGEVVDKEAVKVKVNIKDDRGILADNVYYDGKVYGPYGFELFFDRIIFVREKERGSVGINMEGKSKLLEMTYDFAKSHNNIGRSYLEFEKDWGQKKMPHPFDPDKEIDISSGTHTLRFEVMDIGGNLTSKEITVRYDR